MNNSFSTLANTEIIRLTPMGGVSEIGSNCTVVESDKEMLIIDYGILFPYDECYSIDYLIVDIEQIKSTKKKVSIFITHGHEDHIGAIVHLMREFPDSTIHAPKFAAKLIRNKLHQAGTAATIQIYTQDSVLEFSCFNVYPVKVTHSIPDTYGLVIQDLNLTHSILFISDFKYDLNPLYEIPFQTDHIVKLMNGAKSKSCLIDSTNILDANKTLSERDLLHDFELLISQQRRIFVTLFSSNIFRLKTIIAYAKKFNKLVIPIGRSVQNYLNAASECDLLDESELSVIRQESQIQDFDSQKNIFILTGCQGDHFGALRRVASGEHRNIKLSDKDVVVFSSKPIPGNAKKISRIYNLITEQGAEIVTAMDRQIHASGHPGAKDLKLLYDAIRPDYIIPIHGESFFLKRHHDFIKEQDIAIPVRLTNFQTLNFLKDATVKTSKVYEQKEPIIIQSNYQPIERGSISQRRKIAQSGAIFISLHKEKRKLKFSYVGLPEHLEHHKEKIEKLIKGQLDRKLMQKDDNEISETLRIFSRNIFNNFLSYKPIVFIHTV